MQTEDDLRRSLAEAAAVLTVASADARHAVAGRVRRQRFKRGAPAVVVVAMIAFGVVHLVSSAGTGSRVVTATVPPRPQVTVAPGVTQPSPTSLPPPSGPYATLTYLQSGIGLLGFGPVGINSGEGPSRLLMTNDFTHWRDVTPKQVGPDPSGLYPGVYPYFETAFFLTPQIGWVTTYNDASLSVRVYRTVDGARTWQTEATTLEHGLHAGAGVKLQFFTASDGIEGTFDPNASNGDELSTTSDGGAHWTLIGPGAHNGTGVGVIPEAVPFVFSDRETGFAGPPSLDSHLSRYVWETHDGGKTWAKFVPTRLPANTTGLTADYELPTFFGRDGAMSARFTAPDRPPYQGGPATLAFFTSHDAGHTWSLAGTKSTDIGSTSSKSVFGPTVDVVSPTSWWVTSLPGGGPGAPQLVVTNDAGAHWEDISADLPANLTSVELLANGLSEVWLIDNGASTTRLFSTSDGGHHWLPLTVRP